MNDGTAGGDRAPADSAVPAADDERAEGAGLGDATISLTPGQLAFLALIAAVPATAQQGGSTVTATTMKVSTAGAGAASDGASAPPEQPASSTMTMAHCMHGDAAAYLPDFVIPSAPGRRPPPHTRTNHGRCRPFAA